MNIEQTTADLPVCNANGPRMEQSVPANCHSVASLSEAELISSVRCDPPDEAALEVLITRYRGYLFARCQMLTLNHENALDLSQATWCRLLRNRQALKADGNFRAYLGTIATNLFRDSYRSARRAGPMAENHLASLDSLLTNNENDELFLKDTLCDLDALEAHKRTLLKMDIDAALRQLTPQLREMLVARFIDGESCAEIGLRCGRPEQTISRWVREALRQMKTELEKDPPAGRVQNQQPETHRINTTNSTRHSRELAGI